MTPSIMMHLDAIVLVACSLLLSILLCEDRLYRPILPAILMALLALTQFLQAMWLLGIWIPGTAGYPWPRLSIDLLMMLVLVWRVGRVLKEKWHTDRRGREV